MDVKSLLLLGGIFYLATADSSPSQPTPEAIHNAPGGFLASGDYDNEDKVAKAILTASSASEALAAARVVVASPPPLTTDQLSTPESNANYGRVGSSPYDLSMIQPVIASYTPPPTITHVSPELYARKQAYVQDYLIKSHSTGDRGVYFTQLYLAAKKELDMLTPDPAIKFPN